MSYFEEVINHPFSIEQVLAGDFFFWSTLNQGVATGTSLDILIITGAEETHLFSSIKVEAKFTIELYEGTTVSDNGTAQTIQNLRRSSANTPNGSIYTGPTVDSVGTLIENDAILGGGGGGGASATRIGGIAQRVLGWVLDVSTNYLLRITNNSGGASDIARALSFYEGI